MLENKPLRMMKTGFVTIPSRVGWKASFRSRTLSLCTTYIQMECENGDAIERFNRALHLTEPAQSLAQRSTAFSTHSLDYLRKVCVLECFCGLEVFAFDLSTGRVRYKGSKRIGKHANWVSLIARDDIGFLSSPFQKTKVVSSPEIQ